MGGLFRPVESARHLDEIRSRSLCITENYLFDMVEFFSQTFYAVAWTVLKVDGDRVVTILAAAGER